MPTHCCLQVQYFWFTLWLRDCDLKHVLLVVGPSVQLLHHCNPLHREAAHVLHRGRREGRRGREGGGGREGEREGGGTEGGREGGREGGGERKVGNTVSRLPPVMAAQALLSM